MVTKIENAQAALQAQVNPKPVPQQAAPKPQSRPQAQPISIPKLVPKFVPKQPEPKPDANLKNLAAERQRRLQAAQLEVQQKQIKEQSGKATKELLEQAAEKLKKLAEYISDNTHLIARDYMVHEATNRITVTIYDSVTGEVIREVPGKDFLDRVHRMEQMMGLMFDNLV